MARDKWVRKLARSLARAPIALYQARLGFLLGHRLLLIEHVGRRSGLRRYVVLEVIGRPGPNRYLVPSGFGERSQWLRNVRAEPNVRVSVGRRVLVPARARVLPRSEAEAALRDYTVQHRLSWRLLRPLLRRIAPALDGEPDELAARIPIVELTLQS